MFSESFTTARAPVNLEISQVLAGAFAAIGRHWLAFLILGLVLYGLPYAVTQSFQAASVSHYSDLSQILAATARSSLISFPFSFLFQPLFYALVTWLVWADASKARSDLPAALRAVAPRALWIILANLVVSFVSGFGLILLLVPGIMAILAF